MKCNHCYSCCPYFYCCKYSPFFNQVYLVRRKIEINLVDISPDLSKKFNDCLSKLVNDLGVNSIIIDRETHFYKKKGGADDGESKKNAS